MLLLVEKRFLKLTNSITIQLNTYNSSNLATSVRNQKSSLKKKDIYFPPLFNGLEGVVF